MTLAHRAKLNSQFFFYFITYDLVYLLLFWQIRILPLRILVNSHDKDDYIYKAKLS